MRSFLGVDVGTTSITALVLDLDPSSVVARVSTPNDTETTSVEHRRLGRSEWDTDAMLDRVRSAIRDAVTEAGRPIEAVGVTGQMHGMLLVSEPGRPIGPFIGWQDQRGAEQMADGPSAVERLSAARGPDVCTAKTGYLGATLTWLAVNRALPDAPFTASFIPDYVVSAMTGAKVVTDRTNAAGSGLYDVVRDAWSEEVVTAGTFGLEVLPELGRSGQIAGSLTSSWAELTGLSEGTPVMVSCGDNQASFAGSVADYEEMVLVNVGTGGQVSVHASDAIKAPGIEARPFMDGHYLLVGAGLVGGRTFAWLRDFVEAVGRDVFDVAAESDAIYDALTRLAGFVEAGSDGLSFEPLLTGTREAPDRRGVMTGIGTTNFTPGHLSRALIEGVAEQFRQLYGETLKAGVSGRTRLVGAGNGIRRNPVLREVLESAFGLTMEVPRHTEEAAYGAALLASVGVGEKRSLAEASTGIAYE